MDFLVDTTVRLPPALSAEERLELMRAERARGRELVEAGAIQHIWRIPGAVAGDQCDSVRHGPYHRSP